MKYYTVVFFVCFCVIAGIAASCDDKPTGGNTTAFNRKAMLENVADNIIRPNYAGLRIAAVELDAAVNVFIVSPTPQNLASAQSALDKAYTAWQHCAMFDFGPADSPLGTLNEEIGTFPASVNGIESAIAQKNFTTNNFRRDTRGFAALEYLLFSDSSVNQVVMRFVSNSDRGSVLQTIAVDLQSKIGNVVAAWSNEPTALGTINYRNDFVNNDGTNVGSSTSLLFNAFVANYELLKNFKFGIPAGRRAGQTDIAPEKSEAYYSGRSLQYAKEHFRAIENLWKGTSRTGADGIGFEEYLASVPGGSELIANTKQQFAGVQAALDRIPSDRPFSAVIQSNPSPVADAHTELQKLTRFLKSDMSSLLGLQITFSSNDGD